MPAPYNYSLTPKIAIAVPWVKKGSTYPDRRLGRSDVVSHGPFHRPPPSTNFPHITQSALTQWRTATDANSHKYANQKRPLHRERRRSTRLRRCGSVSKRTPRGWRNERNDLRSSCVLHPISAPSAKSRPACRRVLQKRWRPRGRKVEGIGSGRYL